MGTTQQPQCSAVLTPAQRKEVAKLAPDLAGRLKLDEDASRTILMSLSEATNLRTKTQRALRTARGMPRNSLASIFDALRKSIDAVQGIGAIPNDKRVYQFKITLMGIRPAVWRRIQVKNCELDTLHERIQLAMGWTNSHLHEFMIDGQRYGDPWLLEYEDADEPRFVSTRETYLKDLVPKSGSKMKFDYSYDFGDSWEHEIVFEGCLLAELGQRYPLCVEGESACPPEDVGGISGYAEYRKIMRSGRGRQYAEFLEWRGPFDPDAFDADAASRRMRRGMPDWRKTD